MMKLALALLFAATIAAHAATRTADSTAYADVNAAVNGGTGPGGTTFVGAAADGDTVIVPAGTSTWTTTLNISHNIILQGATTVTGVSESSVGTVTNNTVIMDGLTGSSPSAGSIIYTNYNGSNPGDPVIKGFTFNGTASSNGAGYMVYLFGTHHNFRVTQCNFYKTSDLKTSSNSRYALFIDGDSFGLVDHCSSTQNQGSEKFSVNAQNYGGGSFGDLSWTEGPHFLNSDPKRAYAVYFENCAFISGPGKHGSLDSQRGGRRVIRHCRFVGAVTASHGTESGGRITRGARVTEIYDNTFDYSVADASNTGVELRAGTWLFWGNSYITTPTFSRGFLPKANRQLSYFSPWGGATGENPLDANDTSGTGVYVAGDTPHVFFSTTVNSIAGNVITLTDTTGATNYANYEVMNNNSGSANYKHNALIASTSGTTMTLNAQFTGAQPFANGDAIQVRRVMRSLDQPGKGKGDLVVGNPPTNTQWPNQNTEPLYSWMNTNSVNGGGAGLYTSLIALPAAGAVPTVIANRDFFNSNASFAPSTTHVSTISTGTGYGTLANRPDHCTPGSDGAQPQSGDGNAPGVGYWATDTNTFSVCTATDTWTDYYEPYTYPHPLTGNSTGAIIVLSGNLAFGNVIIGETPTATLTVQNTGDTLLTVTSVSYPTGFTGATTGFTVAAGATHDITVTYTPIDQSTSSGNITVSSDATGGTPTIGCSGTGVLGPNQRPSTVFRKINQVLSKVAP